MLRRGAMTGTLVASRGPAMRITATPSFPSPFVVAHRGGNDLAALRLAEALGVGLVEADVHLFAGRLEVRHLKRIGPLPLLWDRWQLSPPWRNHLLLHDLLAATRPETHLLLDLKPPAGRVARALARCLDAHGGGRRVSVCSRNWRALEALRGRDGVRLVHSVGTRWQLAALRARLASGTVAGVSIHQRLLDPAVVAELKRHVDLLVSWPVETAEDGRRLAGWGVDGLISKRFDVLADAVRAGS